MQHLVQIVYSFVYNSEQTSILNLSGDISLTFPVLEFFQSLQLPDVSVHYRQPNYRGVIPVRSS